MAKHQKWTYFNIDPVREASSEECCQQEAKAQADVAQASNAR